MGYQLQTLYKMEELCNSLTAAVNKINGSKGQFVNGVNGLNNGSMSFISFLRSFSGGEEFFQKLNNFNTLLGSIAESDLTNGVTGFRQFVETEIANASAHYDPTTTGSSTTEDTTEKKDAPSTTAPDTTDRNKKDEKKDTTAPTTTSTPPKVEEKTGQGEKPKEEQPKAEREVLYNEQYEQQRGQEYAATEEARWKAKQQREAEEAAAAAKAGEKLNSPSQDSGKEYSKPTSETANTVTGDKGGNQQQGEKASFFTTVQQAVKNVTNPGNGNGNGTAQTGFFGELNKATSQVFTTQPPTQVNSFKGAATQLAGDVGNAKEVASSGITGLANKVAIQDNSQKPSNTGKVGASVGSGVGASINNVKNQANEVKKLFGNGTNGLKDIVQNLNK